MTRSLPRRTGRRITWLALLLSVVVPRGAGAAPHVVASRGHPSSLSGRYGRVVPLEGTGAPGLIVAPTRAGIEIRDAADPTLPLLGSLRLPGRVDAAAASGSLAYVLSGSRGIVAVDLSDPSDPHVVGEIGGLGDVARGAVAPAADALIATGDSALHVIALDGVGGMELRSTRTVAAGRGIRGLAARGDSVLLASVRLSPTLRTFVTLFRVNPAGGTLDSLWEVTANAVLAEDLVWRGRLAFLALGNDGVRPVDTGLTPQFIAGPAPPPTFVRAVDANDTLVALAGVPQAVHYFARSGPMGETLTPAGGEALDLQPAHAALVGDRLVVATDEQFFEPQEPDEQGLGLLEVRSLAGGVPPPAVGGTGRARRAAAIGSHVLLADYTGGMRIYGLSDADTSLVGLIALPTGGLALDVAVDPPRGRAYVAGGSAGLLIADVATPGSPSVLSILPLAGSTRAVAVIDSGLIVTLQRESGRGRVTFVDVSTPSLPTVLGSLAYLDGQDPRAVATRDSVAFVADGTLGVFSVGFGDPSQPVRFGTNSGAGARDVDLAGDLLLVGTSLRGLQVVDVTDPTRALIRAELGAPPIEGVCRSGDIAAIHLGEDGVALVDVSVPTAPQLLGPIAVPGFARDGFLSGDSLLVVAARYGLERVHLEALRGGVAPLSLGYDERALAPGIRVAWPQGLLSNGVGWNLYRSLGPVQEGLEGGGSQRVNSSLGPPSDTETVDPAPVSGTLHRYRLEVLLRDGHARKVAEGSLFIPSTARVGSPYPNPYRPALGPLTLRFRVLTGGAPVELRVFDVAGRLTARVEAMAPAGGGFGSVTWDGRDRHGRLAVGGLYFLDFVGSGLREARRVVLLR